MRTAINDNRTVQLALLGVLLLAGALVAMTVSKSGQSKSSAAQPTATSSAGPTAAPGGASPPTAAGAPDTTTAASAGASDASTGSSSAAAPTVPIDMIPGPGLPRSLLAAYRHGKAIALLVVRAGGTDDRLVHTATRVLHAGPHLELYTTRARHIARFASLTQGVDVSQLPALVVVRPRGHGHGTPIASASYGYRDSAEVLQAVRDAFYRGPTVSYHP